MPRQPRTINSDLYGFTDSGLLWGIREDVEAQSESFALHRGSEREEAQQQHGHTTYRRCLTSTGLAEETKIVKACDTVNKSRFIVFHGTELIRCECKQCIHGHFSAIWDVCQRQYLELIWQCLVQSPVLRQLSASKVRVGRLCNCHSLCLPLPSATKVSFVRSSRSTVTGRLQCSGEA